MNPEILAAIADTLMAAQDAGRSIAPVTDRMPEFDVAAAYDVLRIMEDRRRARGWQPAGRKIGFTNRTIWPRYGVFLPMWAHTWNTTVHHAHDGHATMPLQGLVEPRIEPEVVFGVGAAVPDSDDAREILRHVEWIAPGFEIVHSLFPDWKFKAADCTAAFGLHAALVVGTRVPVTDGNRDSLVDTLSRFELTLRNGATIVDRGIGANVLDSPALALAHLVRVLATQPRAAPLAAGEIVTTGTVTDAWPVAAGETWTSDYGVLGLQGLELRFR